MGEMYSPIFNELMRPWPPVRTPCVSCEKCGDTIWGIARDPEYPICDNCWTPPKPKGIGNDKI